jgi:1,4-alpha-glucan branching enzyme
MGGEFAQFSEWDYSRELDWNVLEYGAHASMQKYVADLNHFYLRSPEFWEEEEDWDGFRWISCNDSDQNIIIFARRSSDKDEIIVICNFAPVKRTNYSIKVPKMGIYKEIFSSDDVTYGGEGNHVQSAQAEEDENGIFIKVDIPPLSTVFLKIS